MITNNSTIAIASGKRGTGKTTVATNLALTLARTGRKVELLDCDVEEPNCHLFLKPIIESSIPLMVPMPIVDESKCTGCGECGSFCQYSAIVVVKGKVLVFPELCHSCGGCWLVCPEGALTPEEREHGVVETGHAEGLRFVQGRMRVGQASPPSLIRKVKGQIDDTALTLIDASPGTSCPVVEAVRGSDFVILVTEPTPFGFHDLKLAVDMTRAVGIPFGVVINRKEKREDEVCAYCLEEGIPVLAEIPDDRKVAEAYSRGEIIIDALPAYRELFLKLADELERQITNSAVQPSGKRAVRVVGKVPYDMQFTEAQVQKASLLEYSGGATSQVVKKIWRELTYALG